MKGGSIASDSVISNLDTRVFDKLNAMFDNKVGGGCGCKKKTSVRRGGSAFGSMMGSTMEAFQGNVRSMPHEMFSGPNSAVLSSATSTTNVAKKTNVGMKAPNAGMKAPNSGMRAPNSGIKPPNAGMRAPNAGMKAPNAGMKAPNAGMRAPNAGMKVPNSGMRAPNAGMRAPNAGMRAPNAGMMANSGPKLAANARGGSNSKKIGGSSNKFPTAAYSGEGGKCTKCGSHRGGNISNSITVYPTNNNIANANVGQTMSQLMANSSGIRVQNKKLHGGKDIPIGPNLNIWDVPYSTRNQVQSTVNDVLATEGISSSPQIQKFMNYGSPSDKFPQPFSYGQSAGKRKGKGKGKGKKP